MPRKPRSVVDTDTYDSFLGMHLGGHPGCQECGARMSDRDANRSCWKCRNPPTYSFTPGRCYGTCKICDENVTLIRKVGK